MVTARKIWDSALASCKQTDRIADVSGILKVLLNKRSDLSFALGHLGRVRSHLS